MPPVNRLRFFYPGPGAHAETSPIAHHAGDGSPAILKRGADIPALWYPYTSVVRVAQGFPPGGKKSAESTLARASWERAES